MYFKVFDTDGYFFTDLEAENEEDAYDKLFDCLYTIYQEDDIGIVDNIIDQFFFVPQDMTP